MLSHKKLILMEKGSCSGKKSATNAPRSCRYNVSHPIQSKSASSSAGFETRISNWEEVESLYRRVESL